MVLGSQNPYVPGKYRKNDAKTGSEKYQKNDGNKYENGARMDPKREPKYRKIQTKIDTKIDHEK